MIYKNSGTINSSSFQNPNIPYQDMRKSNTASNANQSQPNRTTNYQNIIQQNINQNKYRVNENMKLENQRNSRSNQQGKQYQIVNDYDQQYDRNRGQDTRSQSLNSNNFFDRLFGNLNSKFYILLIVQLIMMLLVCLLAMNSEGIRKLLGHTATVIIFILIMLALLAVIIFGKQQSAQYALPIFIALTITFAIFTGIICSYKQGNFVLMVIVACIIGCLGSIIYNAIRGIEQCEWQPYAFTFILVMVIFGITCIFWKEGILSLFIACMIALAYLLVSLFWIQCGGRQDNVFRMVNLQNIIVIGSYFVVMWNMLFGPRYYY